MSRIANTRRAAASAFESSAAASSDRSAAAVLDRSASRRTVLRGALGVGVLLSVRPAYGPTPPDLEAAVRAFARGAPVRTGKVLLDVAPLVENGNAVPVTVSVESPMTPAEHVQSIAIFNERNPQRDVAVFTLGARAGRARVATRIRLSTSQKLIAVARLSDGSHWQHGVDVIVTLAACVEG
jgi:sulfur-oxidizing protein SoxY